MSSTATLNRREIARLQSQLGQRIGGLRVDSRRDAEVVAAEREAGGVHVEHEHAGSGGQRELDDGEPDGARADHGNVKHQFLRH